MEHTTPATIPDSPISKAPNEDSKEDGIQIAAQRFATWVADTFNISTDVLAERARNQLSVDRFKSSLRPSFVGAPPYEGMDEDAMAFWELSMNRQEPKQPKPGSK